MTDEKKPEERKPGEKPSASSSPAGGATPSPQSAPAAQAAAQPAAGTPQSATPAPAAPPTPAELREQARKRRYAREQELATKLADKLGAAVKARTSFRDQEELVIDRAAALDALKVARGELGFEVLADVTAVDYLKLEGHPERFAVVWNLLSLSQEARLRLKAYLPEEDPTVASASSVWPAADWGEREAFDMFGIEFKGHPHLKRILMPEDYGSFPLRKDYPLRGRGERDNFVVLKRGQKEIEA